jgi:hypothetical protein
MFLIITILIQDVSVNAISVYSRVATATFQLTPGDVIAPHLYALLYNDNSSHVIVNSFALSSQPFSIVMWVRKTYQNAYNGFEWLILKTSSVWFGEFSITIESPGSSKLRVEGNDTSENQILTPTNYLNDAEWHNIAGVYDTQAMYFYIDSSLAVSASLSIPRYTTTSLLYIGLHGYESFYPFMISQVLIYSRSLYFSEIANIYAKNEINSLNLTLFLDATFFNGVNYVDLSNNNNNGIPYNVQRVLDNKTWLYHIVQLYNDGLIHFRFFPLGSKIEIYDTSGKLVNSFYLNGNADAGGMIEDYAIQLPVGTYTIKAYMLAQSFAPGYPASYCGIIQNTDYNAIVSCSCAGLTDQYGIYIDNPDTSQTYTFSITTTFTASGDRILLTMYPDSPPKVIIKLPLQRYTLQNGSQIDVTGLRIRITYIENLTSIQNTIILTQDNYTGSITLTFNQYDVITEVALFIYTPAPPSQMPPSPSSIYDIKGWITMLSYMTWQFLQYIPTALTIFIQVGWWLTQLAPLIIAIIPLSIVFGLVEGGLETAVKVMSFWYELARKLYDFFIKIIQAIASLIDALKPT